MRAIVKQSVMQTLCKLGLVDCLTGEKVDTHAHEFDAMAAHYEQASRATLHRVDEVTDRIRKLSGSEAAAKQVAAARRG